MEISEFTGIIEKTAYDFFGKDTNPNNIKEVLDAACFVYNSFSEGDLEQRVEEEKSRKFPVGDGRSYGDAWRASCFDVGVQWALETLKKDKGLTEVEYALKEFYENRKALEEEMRREYAHTAKIEREGRDMVKSYATRLSHILNRKVWHDVSEQPVFTFEEGINENTTPVLYVLRYTNDIRRSAFLEDEWWREMPHISKWAYESELLNL